MAINPMDELLGNQRGGGGGTPSPSGKKNKDKKKSLKANPIFKELRPIMYYGIALSLGIGVSIFTIFDDSKEYHYKHLTDGMAETDNLVQAMKSDIDSIARFDADKTKLTELVTEKEKELSEANLVRTPLEQSFYFTAYLDSLINKHNINLKDMYVKASRAENGEIIDLTTAGSLPESGYNLLPIYVEFESTYQNVTNLFNDFYTKRIVYDEDLVITNKLDGTINVKMTVKFEKDSGGQPIEGEQTTEQQAQPTTEQQPQGETTVQQPTSEQTTQPVTDQQGTTDTTTEGSNNS